MRASHVEPSVADARALGRFVRIDGTRDCDLLYAAVRENSADDVDALLRSRASSVHDRDELGQTALALAASCGFVDVVALLLHHGADIEAKDSDGKTALSLAVAARHTGVVALLLARGADVNAKSSDGATPLSQAAHRRVPDIVARLLAHGANVSSTDMNGRTPLIHAARRGSVETVVTLLEHGAAVDTVDVKQRTALSYATQRNSFDVTLALVKSDAVVACRDARGRTPLSYAAESGRVNKIVELIQRGGVVCDRDAAGRSPLSYAAHHGYSKAVALLIANGASVADRDNDGRTPLSFAAEWSRVDVVQELLQNGSLATDRDNEGRSPISYAARKAATRTSLKGHDAVIDALLRRVSREESVAQTNDAVALFVAVLLGNFDSTMALIAEGTNVDVATSDGRTPLFYAAEFGRIDLVNALLEHGASVHVRAATCQASRECETPLILAGREGHMQVFVALIDAGAPVNVCSAVNGETPLISAARWDFFAGVHLLVRRGGALCDADVAVGECALIPASLVTMRRLCSATFEFASVCTRVVARLNRICAQLCQAQERQQRDGSLESTLVSFSAILFRVCRLLFVIAKRSTVLARFIGRRAIVSAAQAFHEELDHFTSMLGLADEDSSDESWRSTWDEDQAALAAHLSATLRSDDAIVAGLDTDVERVEAATLLVYELAICAGPLTTDAHSSVQSVLERFLHLTAMEMPRVPPWFISPDDVEFYSWNSVRSSQVTEQFDGKWRQTSVTVATTRMDVDRFHEVASRWFPLNHPHVVKLIGACHLGSPRFFVCEVVPGTRPLREFVNEVANKSQTWSCLLGTALGLQYLHNRGVPHGDIRSENIVVGSDLVARVTGVSFKHALYWMAPDAMRGSNDVTLPGDIYAFGMCIWGALTAKSPWDGVSWREVHKRVRAGQLPDRPSVLCDAEWDLLVSMCASDPSDRVDIATVVHRLKELSATGGGAVRDTDDPVDGDSGDESKQLEHHMFDALEGATIAATLHTIETRCKSLVGSEWMATNVCPALVFIFELLCARHKAPGDVGAIQFCDVLARIMRFVRTAVSDKSVYELVRSRRVAESHRLVYAELDRLLTALNMPASHEIRVWTQGPDDTDDASDSDSDSSDDSAHDGGDREEKPRHNGSEDTDALASRIVSTSSGAVTLHHFGSVECHKCWTQAGLAALAKTGKAEAPSWQLPLQDLVFGASDQIGQGAFGAVFKGTWLDTPVVIKFMGYEEDIDTISTDLLLHEVRIWHGLNHPHVLRLYGASHIDKRYFVCEFAANGDLLDYLRKHETETQHLAWQKLYEAALGLQYLHSMNVAHNDLKCDNIMVGLDGKAKLIDFGLSCLLGEAEVEIDVKRIGAVNWRSPEYLAGKRPSFASDVYSFAMCIIEAVSGEAPWGRSVLPAVVKFKVKRGTVPTMPDAMTPKQRHLIQLMTKFEPSERVKIGFVVDKLREISQDELVAVVA